MTSSVTEEENQLRLCLNETESHATSEKKDTGDIRSHTAPNTAAATPVERQTSKKEKRTTQAEKWEEMFKRLIEFRNKNGHCHVPINFAEDPKLAKWVAAQRRNHRNAGDNIVYRLEERESRLVEIGFEWTAKNQRCVPWLFRFKQLLEFVVRYGNSQVPIGWEENVQLSNWVSAQRQYFHLMQMGRAPTSLNQERIDLLNSIGFVWKAQRGGLKRPPPDSAAAPDQQEEDFTTASPDVQTARARDLLQRIGDDTSKSMSETLEAMKAMKAGDNHQTASTALESDAASQHPHITAERPTNTGNISAVMGTDTQVTLPTAQSCQLVTDQGPGHAASETSASTSNGLSEGANRMHNLTAAPLATAPSQLPTITAPQPLLIGTMYQQVPYPISFVPLTQAYLPFTSHLVVQTPQVGLSSVTQPILGNNTNIPTSHVVQLPSLGINPLSIGAGIPTNLSAQSPTAGQQFPIISSYPQTQGAATLVDNSESHENGQIQE